MSQILNFNPIINNTVPVITSLPLRGLKLDKYLLDGFKRVCRISNSSLEHRWQYTDIDQSIMYSTHCSWVYLITVDEFVFKIGETANYLGIRKNSSQTQPNTGSKSRLGRYINGDSTDMDIRKSADIYLKYGHKIEFYAKECEIISGTTTILGESTVTQCATQKHQELLYLDNFMASTGLYPMWNKSRK